MSGYISSTSSSEGSAAAPASSLKSNSNPYLGGYFTNAKPARMLEMGLVLSIQQLRTGDQGLLVEDDGPSIEVKVLKTPYTNNAGPNYIFTNLTTGEEIIAPIQERNTRWEFYEHTTPVPFVARPGSIEAASLRGSSQLLGGGGSTSASFPIMASAPPLSPSSYGVYQVPFSPSSYAAPPPPVTLPPSLDQFPFSPSSHAPPPLPTLPPSLDQFPFSPSSYAASAARPPTPRRLQTVTVTPGGKRKVRKTRGRKIKRTRKNKSRHI